MWCKSTKLIYNNHVYAENFLFRLFNRPGEGERRKSKAAALPCKIVSVFCDRKSGGFHAFAKVFPTLYHN